MRFGTVAKSLITCLCISTVGIGYVWQKNQIYRLGDEIKKREAALAAGEKRNTMLAAQLAHFLRVIRREEPPLCDVLDATRTLAVIDAIRRAVKVAPEPAGLVEFIHDMPTRPTPASVSTGVASC